MKERIDISTWSRRSQYDNFIRYTHPVFSVVARLDVTGLVHYCKKSGRHFFSEFLYVASRAANEIEEFRTRIDEGEVVRWDYVHPSYIVIREDDSIVTCLTEYVPDCERFYEQSRLDIEAAKIKANEVFNPKIRTDCLYVSCLPWVDLTSFTNPYNFADAAQTSIPRIVWTKYVKEGDRFKMSFSVSAHHAFADGVHAAKLINDVQSLLKEYEK